MKKNISINISGIIFHIEEDGYDRLQKYLDSINKYFSTFEDSSEIIVDIESRIAEIFLAKLKEEKRQVVTGEDVETLVVTMGTVADFQSVEEEPQPQQIDQSKATEESSTSKKEEPQDSKTGSKKRLYRDQRRRVLGGVAAGLGHYFNIDALWIRLLFIILCFGLTGLAIIAYIIMWIVVPESTELEEDTKVKKMYRNPEGKVLGGVANGLAAYFGGDVTVVRLLFVISIFIGGSGLILYIILWIVTPEARSITEKMQMQGEPVTLSSIEQTVKDKLNLKGEEESIWVKLLLFPFRLISALFSALAQILGPAMKFFLEALRVVISLAIIGFGLVFIFALVISSAVLFGMFTGLHGWISISDLPFEVLQGTIPTFGVLSLFICGFIPALSLALLGFTLLFKTTITNAYVGWAMFGIWIIGLVGAGLTIPNMVADFRRSGDFSKTKYYDLKGKQALLTINEVGIDDYEGATLTIRGHEDSVYKLVQNFEARGRNRQQAQRNAEMIDYNVVLRDSVFVFDSNISFRGDANFRFQEVSMTLYIPYGKVFYMDEELEWILRNTIYRYGYNVSEMENNQWQFTDDGLECITCEGRDRYRRDSRDDEDEYGEGQLKFDFENFDEIKAGHNFDIEIRKGDNYEVRLFGGDNELDRVSIRQHGNTLEFDMSNFNWFRMDHDKPVKAEVVMPLITALDLSGACNLEAFGFKGDDLDIDLSGAANVDLDVDYDEIFIEMSGASDLNIEGRADEVQVDISGAATLSALSLEARIGDISVTGVSNAKVFVTEDLQVDVSGVSHVRYKGDPKLRVDESGVSSVERY